MYEIPLTLGAGFLVFFLPGFALAEALRLKFSNFLEAVFFYLSLSIVANVATGFVLGNSVGISSLSVLAVFSVLGLLGVIAASRRLLKSRVEERKTWKEILSRVTSAGWKFPLAILGALCVTGFNWFSAIGTHPIDMGEHVFWAKVVMTTSRMPNYYSVEPLDQAVKFTYGAHLMLAQYFLLTPLPIEDYSWIPSLIGSVALLIGVSLFTFRLTQSKWAIPLSVAIYGMAYQPGGYIQRGNLPDIAGYLLLVSTLYSILRVRKNSSFSYPLGLTSVSILPYHQLAAVMLPTVIAFALVICYFRCREELSETLRCVFLGGGKPLFWGFMLLAGLVYAATVTYVSGSAASQLVTGNWKPYVTPLYEDVIIPGVVPGISGAAGLIVIVKRRILSNVLLVAWASALLFLANALLLGIPLADPVRFLWRLTEPLSITTAILVFYAFGLGKKRDTIRTKTSRRARFGLTRLVLVIFIVALVTVPLFYVASAPQRYLRNEVYYEDDKQIGQWLAVNASPTSVIVNDADQDPTATWVQPFSMKLHFIYRASFATIVAPANYVQIYRDTEVLYQNPNDTRVPQIIQREGITYVVAHGGDIQLFLSSQCFGQSLILRTGESALFGTNPC